MPLCACCKKEVEEVDIATHLQNDHLGPHAFWFDGKKFTTMTPSMSVAEMLKLVDGNTTYNIVLDTREGWVHLSHGMAVDLTQEPHFYAVPFARF